MGNQKPIKSMIIIQVSLFNEGNPNLEQTERCLQDIETSPNLSHLLTKFSALFGILWASLPSVIYHILITFYKCLIANN